jgi:hypothetical protein
MLKFHILYMCYIFMTNYFLVISDIFINNEIFLVTDFINLNIKWALNVLEVLIVV